MNAPATTSMPLVSVLVPAYNHEAFVQQCLDSILAQSYGRFRVLVVDNAPERTATAEVVRSVGRPDLVERIVAPVSGLSRARNVAVASLGTAASTPSSSSSDMRLCASAMKPRCASMDIFKNSGA